jgi:hypothetical protein
VREGREDVLPGVCPGHELVGPPVRPDPQHDVAGDRHVRAHDLRAAHPSGHTDDAPAVSPTPDPRREERVLVLQGDNPGVVLRDPAGLDRCLEDEAVHVLPPG